jgi:pilus assembly protein Flp/PilA
VIPTQKFMRKRLIQTIQQFCRDENGATAIEYALIASGIAGAIIAVITTLGGSVKAMWNTVKTAFG